MRTSACKITLLLQPCVLRLGLLQDGDVGVSVFPEGEEVFVGCQCPDTGGVGISSLRGSRLQCVRTRHAQMRQGSRPAVPDDAAVVENQWEIACPTGWEGVAIGGKCYAAIEDRSTRARRSLLDITDQHHIPVCCAAIHDKLPAIPRHVETADPFAVEVSDRLRRLAR
jgi:hypothetical protein